MLGGPAVLRPPAVVVGPDDLVEKALASEDLVEKDLAVVRLAVIDMEVEGPVRGEESVGFLQSRNDEPHVIVEDVAVGTTGDLGGRVSTTGETHAIPRWIRHDRDLSTSLSTAGIERRIDVDQVERTVLQARKNLGVVGLNDEIVLQTDPVGKVGKVYLLKKPHGAKIR